MKQLILALLVFFSVVSAVSAQSIKHKLVEKNKTIRLAAAKRTIEQLEGGK